MELEKVMEEHIKALKNLANALDGVLTRAEQRMNYLSNKIDWLENEIRQGLNMPFEVFMRSK